MENKRLLIVTQELDPYTVDTQLANLAARLPRLFQDSGYEMRILMPRYGVVNERRHRLHEVVRLSGMNIIVDDDDYPLIIKVASLPGSRLQVYFLDNEDFFKRKHIFTDDDGVAFEDNPDRAAFFCKGAVETVKKFGWAPDVIMCLGWMTSLMPLYLRTAYKTEPLFNHAQIIYGMFDSVHEGEFPERFFQKAAINNLDDRLLAAFRLPSGALSMHKGAAHYADAVLMGSADTKPAEGVVDPGKPVLVWAEEEAIPQALADVINRQEEAGVTS
jgi:starch synthase